MDQKIERNIQKIEGEIYKRTSISNTRLKQKKMRMEVDVLDYTTKRVLSIEYKDRRQ